MFIFILKMFIKLLSVCTLASFSRSLVFNSQEPLRCVTLNNQPCHARPTFVDMNSNETFFIHLLSVLISVVEVLDWLYICSSVCSKYSKTNEYKST